MKLKTCFAVLSSTIVLGGGLMFLNQMQEQNNQKQKATLATVQVYENLELFQKGNDTMDEKGIDTIDAVLVESSQDEQEATHGDNSSFDSGKNDTDVSSLETNAPKKPNKLVRDETIAFTQEQIYDNILPEGQKHIEREGQNGHHQHVYIDGAFIETLVIQEMKPQVIRVGTQKSVSGSFDDARAQAMFQQINAIRQEAGMRPYKWSSKLANSSKIRAKEIHQKFSHTRPNGKSWETIDSNAYGENLARKAYSVEVAVNALMASPEHKANILGPFDEVAIALFLHEDGSWNWVQLFGYS